MFKVFVLFVLVAHLSLSLCFKKPFVQTRPEPMHNFQPHKAAGRWYTLARFIPCNFQGSREFTNMARDLSLVENKNGDKYYAVKQTYRSSGNCNEMHDRRTMDKNDCAVQFAKDLIGDYYSGQRIIVCADYHRYMIQWGCLKFSQENPNICMDTTMAILTRKPNPSKKTREAIDNFLKERFSMVVADLDQMLHGKPCH